jgi:hypothetical protein
MSSVYSQFNPVVISRTSQVVELFASCCRCIIDSRFTRAMNSEQVSEAITAGFSTSIKSISEGIWHLHVRTRTLTDDEFPDHPRFRFLVECSGPFPDLSSAVRPVHHGTFQDSRLHHENLTYPLTALAVSNIPAASGQLSHPVKLFAAIEDVSSLASKFDRDQVLSFLDALRAACLKAERASANFAGVAVIDVVENGHSRVEFETFFAADADTFGAEEMRRRSTSTCYSLPIIVQDSPVGAVS